MKPSSLEKKKGISSLLLTSLLNLPCSLPHTLTTSCSNTYKYCICFVADLPPPDCERCGLLQHWYYGIVTGCDENRHKQWCPLNENKTTHKKIAQTQKALLIYAFLYLFLKCISSSHHYCIYFMAMSSYLLITTMYIILLFIPVCRFMPQS